MGDPFVHEDSGIDPTPPALGIRIIDVLVIQTSISEFDSIRTASSPVNVHPVAKERVIDVACNTDKILAIANLLPLILPDGLQPVKPSIVIDKNMASYRFMEFEDGPENRVPVHR